MEILNLDGFLRRDGRYIRHIRMATAGRNLVSYIPSAGVTEGRDSYNDLKKKNLSGNRSVSKVKLETNRNFQ